MNESDLLLLPRTKYTVIRSPPEHPVSQGPAVRTSYFLDHETRKISAAVSHEENRYIYYCAVGWNERTECWFEQEKQNEAGVCWVGRCQVF